MKGPAKLEGMVSGQDLVDAIDETIKFASRRGCNSPLELLRILSREISERFDKPGKNGDKPTAPVVIDVAGSGKRSIPDGGTAGRK